jgi:NADPH:quinone reductase-like Zn-dependent oxidoreductase
MASQKIMNGVYLKGHGGLDQLEYRQDLPVPECGADEVLIKVSAAGVNNTDINTRIGWYNSEVTEGTMSDSARDGIDLDVVKTTKSEGMGDWNVGLDFPRVQGADIAGRIIETGQKIDHKRIGERVICDPYIRPSDDYEGWENAGFLGADFNGGFAEFVAVPSRNVYHISEELNLTDEALCTLPCSGGTAMNMLLMANVRPGDAMLVTGASGGVGTFLVQIGHALGAKVIAISGKSKFNQVSKLNPLGIADRNSTNLVKDVLDITKGAKLSVIADVVGGDCFTDLLSLLQRGGRYVTAGAIAGPMVTLDLRTLYLKSLEFYGSSAYRTDTVPKLIELVEAGKIKPAVNTVLPLSEIHKAQQEFLEKKHVGSLVLIPG